MATKILSEIATLLDVGIEGLVCMRVEPEPGGYATGDEVRVVGATGDYVQALDGDLDGLGRPHVAALLRQCLQAQQTLRVEQGIVLFFSRFQAGADYACYVRTERELDDTELELLKVFSASISRGLYNVSLFSRLEKWPTRTSC